MTRPPALVALALLLSTGWLGRAPRAPQAPGEIRGTVTVPSSDVRTAERYTATTGEVKAIQPVAAVVYLEGVSAARPARASAPPQLAQKGEAFSPSLLVVPVETEVAFPNGDPFFHNVFSFSRTKRFDLGRYRQGESKTVRFDRPGYVKILCEVHKWMRAGVLVVENPYYAVVPASGPFRIEGVPAGRHRVIVEHFDRRVPLDVDVPAAGVATINVKL